VDDVLEEMTKLLPTQRNASITAIKKIQNILKTEEENNMNMEGGRNKRSTRKKAKKAKKSKKSRRSTR
jgi:hypothetical protein